MAQLLATLTGHRADLQGHWWHRLAMVAFWLTFVPSTLALCAVAYSESRHSWPLAEVRVRAHLDEFPGKVTGVSGDQDVMGNFIALDGISARLGRIIPGGSEVIPMSDRFLRSGVCFPKVQRYIDDDGNPATSIRVTRDGMTMDLMPVANVQGGQVPGNCWLNGYDGILAAHEVVLFDPLEGVDRAYSLRQAGKALLLLLTLALAGANLYYRGFVYIVKGSRPRKFSPSDAQTP